MNKLFVQYQPFARVQNVLVVNEDGETLEKVPVPLDRVNEAIKGFVSQYDVKEINLMGNRDYLQKFKAEMGNDFSLQDIKIEII